MKEERLSLGTVVTLKGAQKKVMIIGRMMAFELPVGKRYFEYVGCPYPEGLLDTQGLFLIEKI